MVEHEHRVRTGLPRPSAVSSRRLLQKISLHKAGVRIKAFQLRFGVWSWAVQNFLDMENKGRDEFVGTVDETGRVHVMDAVMVRKKMQALELRQVALHDIQTRRRERRAARLAARHRKQQARRERWRWGWRATLLGTLGIPLPADEPNHSPITEELEEVEDVEETEENQDLHFRGGYLGSASDE